MTQSLVGRQLHVVGRRRSSLLRGLGLFRRRRLRGGPPLTTWCRRLGHPGLCAGGAAHLQGLASSAAPPYGPPEGGGRPPGGPLLLTWTYFCRGFVFVEHSRVRQHRRQRKGRRVRWEPHPRGPGRAARASRRCAGAIPPPADPGHDQSSPERQAGCFFRPPSMRAVRTDLNAHARPTCTRVEGARASRAHSRLVRSARRGCTRVEGARSSIAHARGVRTRVECARASSTRVEHARRGRRFSASDPAREA